MDNQVSTNENLIVRLSEFFVKNIRFTLLLLLTILLLGFASYTQLLKREGFPSVQAPAIFITGNYLVNDKELVANQVTKIIEQEISKLIEVREVSSLTTENTFQVVVLLDENANPDELSQKINNSLEKAKLPQNAKYSIFVPNVLKFENEFDVIVSLYCKNDISIQELQNKAEVLANDLVKLPDVVQAKVIPLLQETINPINGEKILFQQRQNIITLKEEGTLKNYKAIKVGVLKKENIDSVRFSEIINKHINVISKQDKYNNFNLLVTHDFAPTINKQIRSLEESTIISLLVIILVISLIINIKSALIIGFAVILVLASTMTGLLFTGNTLNVISLFGLILVLGMFVDDAIVVVEAIAKQRAKNLNRFTAIKEAIREVGVAKIAGSITTILVFISMFFISGTLGNFIRLIPTTVIMTLLLSIFLSLTIIAAITVYILKKPQKPNANKNHIRNLFTIINQILSWENPLITFAAKELNKFTSWYLSNKLYLISVVLISLVLVFIGGIYAQKLEFNIFPENENADLIQINIKINTNQNNIQSQEEIISNIYKNVILNYQEYIERISWQAIGTNIEGRVNLTENKNIKAKELAQIIEEKINNLDSSLIHTVNVIIGERPTTSDKYPLKLQIFIEDQEKLENISKLTKKIIKEELSYKNKKNEEIQVIDVVINNLNNISKSDMRRYASIEAKFDKKVDDQDIINMQNIIKLKLSDKLKSEYNLDPNEFVGTKLGQREDFLRSLYSAVVAFILSLIAMYAYLVLQYNSFTLPILVYTAIPFTFPLLFPGLLLIDSPLSFFIMLGLITLSGVVVNNTIIFIDYANSLLKNHNLKTAVALTIKERFRPILATSMTTILGLLPVAIADPFWRGLASGIMFGLLSSTTLVILTFPAYYYIFQKIRFWLKNKLIH